MRIALVVPGGVDRSGEYRVIPALLALLQRLSRVHSVHVFALAQDAAPGKWQLAGAHIHNVGSRLTRVRAVGAVLDQHRAAPFSLIHAVWSGACGLIAVTAARLLRIPSIVHVAGGELTALPEIGYGGTLKARGRLREHLTLRGASVVSAASAPIISAIKAFGVTARRIPLGVDLAVWPPQPPVHRDSARPARLIHVASLNPVKDQPTLLRALAELAHRGFDFQLDVVGEDVLSGSIQTLARQLQLSSRVQFHGFLPQRLLRPLVETAHMMIISSRHEAGPLVALEAAAAGVPTVGTAVGHIQEWAPHAAIAVPVGDCTALADAIARLLADETLRLRIAREAHQRAILEDADYTAQEFQAIYSELTRSAAGR